MRENWKWKIEEIEQEFWKQDSPVYTKDRREVLRHLRWDYKWISHSKKNFNLKKIQA